MRKLRVGLPSPAIVIAILALVAAVAGSAVADPVANTAVSKKKTKKIAKNQAKKYFNANIGDATVANAENLGDQPPDAFQSRVQWALVNAAGTSILAQSGDISITGHAIGRTGLRFPDDTDTSTGAINAQVTAFGFAGTGGGVILSKVGPCPATQPDCGAVGGTASTDVVIDTFLTNGNFADAGTFVTFTP
jgi:hypothetical protein